jgi:DegV family protein with EDD domain
VLALSDNIKTFVVTDSTGSFNVDELEDMPLIVVPMNMILNGKNYRDGIDITTDEFYQHIATTGDLPQTSAVAPAGFQAAFKNAKKDVLCITVSAQLSATYDSARTAIDLAQEENPTQRIELLDSGTAGGAQALVALAAARAANAGQTLEEVTEVTRRVAQRVYFIGVLESLKHLQRGGRVPRVAAWAASLLNIKPVLAIWPGEGKVRMIERPRSKPKAIERLLNVIERESEGKPIHSVVMHAAVPEEAETLATRIRERFDCVETLITPFTPVIGAHTGPGLLGVAFYADE